jgi:GT2 family glycosyltransferase
MSDANSNGEAGRLFILLPVHNRREITTRFVESLAKQTCLDFRLILIDDGSIDGTAEAVRALWPAVVVITGTGGWWWGGCLQQAWLWLRRSPPAPDAIIAICNDDMEITDDLLECAKAELQETPSTLLLARQLEEGRQDEQPSGVSVDLKHLRFVQTNDPAIINCLPTRGLFCRWEDFDRVGGFHPRLLPHYFSDYEFTMRAKRRGLHLHVARSVVIRSGDRTTGLTRESILSAPLWRRPAMLLSQRHKENPLAWSGFVLLVVPWRRWPWLLFKVWANTARLMVATRRTAGDRD